MVNGAEPGRLIIPDAVEEKPLPPECCAKCRFARGIIHHPELTQQFGSNAKFVRVCHRYPPTMFVIINPHVRPTNAQEAMMNPPMNKVSEETRVQYDSWCGEYKPSLAFASEEGALQK